MIRPGTDLSLNYALIHVILKKRLYDRLCGPLCTGHGRSSPVYQRVYP
jgi:hypothetical protein